MSGSAAFYDLDRTLVEFNSGWLYAKYEREHRRIGRMTMAKAAFALLRYHLSLIDMERAYRKLLGRYRGLDESVVRQRTEEWFARDVAGALLPGAKKALELHRSSGRPNVMLTNSSCYVAQVATASWGLDDWMANIFELDASGALTGLFELPLCHGEGKVIRAKRWAADNGVDLRKSWFYSDSYSDVPMLAAVGEPRVVNPDPRLAVHARRRGWPVLDWR